MFALTFKKVQFVCSDKQIVCSCFVRVIEAADMDVGQRSACLFLADEHLPSLDKRLSRVNC